MVSGAPTAQVDRDAAAARTRFAATIEQIGRSAADRERERTLPFAELAALREAGFLAARVPRADGGLGLSAAELLRWCVALGAADPNVAQVLRSHFGFVEARRLEGPDGERWLRRVADGALIGNASSEVGTANSGAIATRLDEDRDGRLRLTGRKAYSTGALFADLVVAFALRGDGYASVVVPRTRAGVSVIDDWDGFGQRLTGSGTTIFSDVAVAPDELLAEDPDGASYLFPYFQLHLLAALAGIGRRVRDDAVAAVAGARRTFGYGAAGAPKDDPLVQEVLGRLTAAAVLAEACVVRAGETIDALQPVVLSGGEDATVACRRIADEVGRAQVVVTRTVLGACRRLYDSGGASLVLRGTGLDRHWRNARTIASHNPASYRARAVGDALINGTPVPLTAP